MFDNIGKKIQTMAKVMTVIGMIISFIIGFFVWDAFQAGTVGWAVLGCLFSLLCTGFGCLISWIGSFFIYGFGQLIENSDHTIKQLREINSKTVKEGSLCPLNPLPEGLKKPPL